MRAAYVLADVLEAVEDGRGALTALKDAGIAPVVLVPRPIQSPSKVDTSGFPVVACNPDEADCWGPEPTLVLDASRRSGAPPSEAFMVCLDVADVGRAAEAGCRPVLVLAGRSISEVYGPNEPEFKASICADSLDEAVSYMQAESELHAQIGPFPYAHVAKLDERARAEAPSARDLTRLMVATIAAGTAVALGIAYILQELYQRGTFPDEFYYLTLQFIPQYFRGGLFLLIGAAIAIFAMMSLDRLPARFRRG